MFAQFPFRDTFTHDNLQERISIVYSILGFGVLERRGRKLFSLRQR